MDKASNISKSVHLSASAGSGKTRALKERYLALLDVLDNRGLNIDQAVAITFTDKAAAEIKERVLRDLPEAMLKKIIRGRQDLRISTIHSFCMNLLKRYPLEAGLPPDFGVLDTRDQASKIQQAVEDALEESDRDPAIMAPLMDFTVNELLATVEHLLSIRSRLKRMEIDSGGPEGLLNAVRTGTGVDRAEAELKALVESNDWRAGLLRMERILRSHDGRQDDGPHTEHRALSETTDVDTAFKAARPLVPIYFTNEGKPRKYPSISKKDFRGKNRAEYETAFFDVQDLLGQFRTLCARMRAGREAVSLLRLFQRAEEHYQKSKLREGLLDFDDLEIFAYQLLRGLESPDILYWLDRKILHFLVDEFQDTSDIQWAILNTLTEELFSGQGADKRMQPTLFVVGDEKQSIYRFREANYRLIENVKQKMETRLPADAREIRTLDRNYRSTPELVEIVNRLFTGLWGEAYEPFAADRSAHQGSVRLIEITPTSGKGPEDPTEERVLARELKSLVENRTKIYERLPDSGSPGSGNGWKEREAGYGDCAILIQSRTKLKDYEDALQAEKVPYRVIGGIGFYEEDEIQALMNVLFFLWNRDDRLALAAALKSPLFGLTDGDIHTLMQNDAGPLDALERLRPADGKRVRDWMNLTGLMPLSGLLHRIISDSGAYLRFGRRNPQALFNIDKLLDTAREFDRRGYTTLQDFVERVKNIRLTEQREASADLNLPGFQGSVDVMTVHKAKGLEYHIVFLPGMNQQPKSLSAGPRAIIEDGKNGIRMAIKDDASPVYDELWEREKNELMREHQRLLYVAMTRARDHLVLLGMLGDGKTPIKQNTWLGYVHETAALPLFEKAAAAEAGLNVYTYPSLAAIQARTMNLDTSGKDRRKEPAPSPIDVKAVLNNLAPVPRSETPEWKTATDFIHQEKDTVIAGPSLQTDPRVISPLTRGSVFHRCLEEYTIAGAYDLDRIMSEYPDLRALGNDVRQSFSSEAESVLKSVLRNKEHAWIFERRPDSYSELPFLYKKGHAIVSGKIDRVVIKDGKGYVIDYKSILIENEEALESWTDHYRPQVRIYCEAVKDIFAVEDIEGYLLFLDSARLEKCVPA